MIIHKQTQGSGCASLGLSLSKKLRRICRFCGKPIEIHFPPGRVPGGKYFTGCKCGICSPRANKLCARQTAKICRKSPKGFSDSQRPRESDALPWVCLCCFAGSGGSSSGTAPVRNGNPIPSPRRCRRCPQCCAAPWGRTPGFGSPPPAPPPETGPAFSWAPTS